MPLDGTQEWEKERFFPSLLERRHTLKITKITRHQNSFISLSSSLIVGSSAHRYMEKIHLFTQKDLRLCKACILAEETEIPETKIHLKY